MKRYTLEFVNDLFLFMCYNRYKTIEAQQSSTKIRQIRKKGNVSFIISFVVSDL